MLAEKIREVLTGDDEGRLCKDIPEAACKHQPRNFALHVLSLAATKTGEGLADPKLILAWLLGALGAPAAAIGFLVPIRESLALLPQLFTSASIRTMPTRKWAWATGSAVQGVCVLAMAAVTVTFDGAIAGWSIVALLAIFALARSVCSVSYKDVQGKTISKQTRGTATGAASSASAALVLAFGVLISTGVIPLTTATIAAALVMAGGLWIAAAIGFTRIVEEPGATEGGANGITAAIDQLALLKRDPQLVRFIAVRGLLIATALAPPFLLALAGQAGERSLATLGPFVIAASLASIFSGLVWGRFADRSSRWVLICSGLTGGAVLGAVGVAALAGSIATTVTPLMAGALFVMMVAYQGVRLGRSTHLTDMADENRRASYTALSNTVIGLLLLVGGVFGLIADAFGTAVVLCIFSVMSLLASAIATGLEEVQAS
jgi:hypothetical protein